MNTIKLLSATLIFAAASSAFAGTDDGVFPNATRVQATAVRQVPAPAAASAETKADVSKNAGKQDFTRQQSEGSNY
jgi:hypothetical protein